MIPHLILFLADTARDESHIIYVAITRAKKHLLLPEKVTKVLHLAHVSRIYFHNEIQNKEKVK